MLNVFMVITCHESTQVIIRHAFQLLLNKYFYIKKKIVALNLFLENRYIHLSRFFKQSLTTDIFETNVKCHASSIIISEEHI